MNEMTLDELRTSRGATQTQISQALGITQAAVSKLEFRNDLYISSVRKYIDAIGGRMEIHAIFPDNLAIKVRGLDGDEKLSLLRSMFHTDVKVSPELQGNTVPCQNRFRLLEIDDEERTLQLEKDSGHKVYIPIRRILEVLPAIPFSQEPGVLVINGIVRWLPEKHTWRFAE